jgi:RHS repeat-associated protein
MQMQLSSDLQIPEGLLAANALLAENSRQGFETYSGTLHQGFGFVISLTSLGIIGPLYDGDVRSRCTGKERDAESGNDYFGARYYASSMGRFSSPDPGWLLAADLTNPQSWNMYSYVLNNPLINIDPTGMECVWDDGSYDAADDKQTGNAAGCSGQGGTYVDPNLFEHAALTNGQNANIQYGSWSGQANSNLAQNWTSPSITSDATPQNAGVTYDNFGTAHFNLDPNYNYNSPDFVNRPTSSIGPTPPPPVLPPPSLYECLADPDDAMAIHRAAQQMNAGQRINPGPGDESAMGKAGQQIRFYGGNAKQQLRMIGNADADTQFSGGALIASQAAASGQCLLTK